MRCIRLLLVLGWMAALGVLAGPVDGDLRPAVASHDFPLRPFEGGNSDWRIVLKRYGPGEAIFVFEPPGQGDTATGTLRSVDPQGLIGSMHGEFGLAGTLRIDGRVRPMKVLLAPATRAIPCRTRAGTAHPQAILASVGRSDPHGVDDSRILYGCGDYVD